MKFRYYASFLLMVSAIFNITSCTSESIPEKNSELTSDVSTLIQLESMNDLALHVADVYVNFLETLKNYDPKDSIYSLPNQPYFEVEIEGVVVRIKNKERNKHPRDIFIDFGTNGVSLRCGNLFKGQVNVHETAAMTDSNATRTYKFTKFSINDHQLKGRNTVTFLGQNSDLKPRWKIITKDTLSFQDGRTHYWNADRTRTCIYSQSKNTPTDLDENAIDSIRFNTTEDIQNKTKVKSMMLWDNLYSVYGISNGINTKGKTYSTRILESHPLKIGMGFPYYISGQNLIKEGKDLLLMDFGDQKEDYWVTATLHGVSMDYNILEQFGTF